MNPPVGQDVMVGGAVSTNLMCCTTEAALPHESVAVHVRLMSRRVQPDEGASLYAITAPPAQLSVAVAMPVTAGSVELPH